MQLMNRREDMQEAVEQLREHVNFDKDIKVRKQRQRVRSTRCVRPGRGSYARARGEFSWISKVQAECCVGAVSSACQVSQKVTGHHT